jgi:hypothetical protein
MEETCGKNTSEVGRHHQKELLDAVECKKDGGDKQGIELSGGEEARGVAPLTKNKKKKRKKTMAISSCVLTSTNNHFKLVDMFDFKTHLTIYLCPIYSDNK